MLRAFKKSLGRRNNALRMSLPQSPPVFAELLYDGVRHRRRLHVPSKAVQLCFLISADPNGVTRRVGYVCSLLSPPAVLPVGVPNVGLAPPRGKSG